MLNLDILQTRWLILALSGGVILVLGTVLAYLALWRPREEEAGDARQSGPAAPPASFTARVPWFVLLTFAGLAAWAIVYVWVQAMYPPNW